MADSALIDDLERQFAENPRRVFARLANEYRKAGDAERAIEICRHHVPQQPGYISGHIVLGQALFDTAQFDEARSAFETALGLDPENLIALRQLGDIARETGDHAGARSWYRRLLEVDPQNEDVAEQLQTLDAGGDHTDPAASTTPASEPEQEQVHWGDIHPEDVAPEAAGAPPTTPDVDSPLPFVSLAPEPGAEEATVSDGGDGAPEIVGSEIVLDTSALLEPAPAAADEPAALIEATEMAPLGLEQLSAEGNASEPASSEHGEAAAETGVPESETSDEGPSDAFVTETMAELYVRQGFVEQALDIYRQLARQSPEEPRFQDAVSELESTLAAQSASMSAAFGRDAAGIALDAAPAGPTIREFLSAIAARRARVKVSDPSAAGGAGPERSDDAEGAPDYNGGTAHRAPVMEAAMPLRYLGDDMFPGHVIAERDEEAAGTLADAYLDGDEGDGDRRGEPAHPAPDELSLDAVFRDAPARGSRSHERNVSFDEFFAGDPRSSHGDAPADANAPSSEAGASSPSDLELFHAWLEGLKK